MDYKLVVPFEEKGEKVKDVQEQLTLLCDFTLDEDEMGDVSRDSTTNNFIGSGTVTISNDGQKVLADFVPNADFKRSGFEMVTRPFVEDSENSQFPPGSILRPALTLLPLIMFRPYAYELLSEIAIYDFDPRLPKKAVQIVGKADLESDGSNLALVLKNILEDEEQQRKFNNLIRDILPFVENLRIEKFADKSMFFELKESYSQNKYLPASLLSDGTINVTALIIALYFEQNPLTIIEEPERNIHPSLIARVVDMMQEVSKKRQIIVSTHNAEMVKYSDLDNLLLLARDDEGFSTIFKPAERDTVRTFLKGRWASRNFMLETYWRCEQ